MLDGGATVGEAGGDTDGGATVGEAGGDTVGDAGGVTVGSAGSVTDAPPCPLPPDQLIAPLVTVLPAGTVRVVPVEKVTVNGVALTFAAT